jgi:eukaryotic-like serine/threonine-protein kinase
MPLLTGTSLGPYEILAPVGAGGMGEVYKARDTRLGRAVAIKVLPAGLAGDPERLERFTREARAASALNHPHIVTVYEAGEIDGVRLIAMELVDGVPFDRWLRQEHPDVGRVLEVLGQVADGLAAAHEAGLLHRDIKPANLLIARAGYAKIVDFGLARSLECADPSAETITAAPLLTGRGAIIGTVAYMSPEQALGQPLDARSDVFSLGVVLYEALAHRRPFQGTNNVELLAAVTQANAAPLRMRGPRAQEVGWIVAKALARDRNERYQSMRELAADLRRLRRRLDEPAPEPIEPAGNRWRTVALLALAGLVALAVFGAVTALRQPSSTPAWFAAQVIATQLTNYGGSERSGAVSPDGRSFAFVSEHGGMPDIWVRQVSGGEAVRLTHDAAEEADLIYAPNGEAIYFTRRGSTGPEIWQIGVLGGQPRKVLANAQLPCPSPDGRSLAYMTVLAGDYRPELEGRTVLEVSALDGTGTRRLADGLRGVSRPALSPDGRWISYSDGGLFEPRNLFIVAARGGRTRQITHFTRSGEGIQWQAWLPDSRHLLVAYSSGPRVVAFHDLGILDSHEGAITRLTMNLAQSLNSPSLSVDGSRVLATAVETRREVWKAPLGPDPDANGRTAVRLVDATKNPMWTFVSRDGRVLLFSSLLSGSRNLWTMPLDGSAPALQITAIAGDSVMHSSLSPDGSRVAFASNSGGSADIWIQNVDGSDLRQLTSDPGADHWPVWFPDGRSIVFGSLRGGSWETWQVPASGGRAEKVVDGFFRGDLIRQPSGGGVWLVSSLSGGSGIRLLDFERRAQLWEQRVPGAGLSLPVFSSDGRSISLPIQESRTRAAIWIFDSVTGQRRLAAKLSEPFFVWFRADWVDGGKAVAVNREETVSHIVLFDRVK